MLDSYAYHTNRSILYGLGTLELSHDLSRRIGYWYGFQEYRSSFAIDFRMTE